MERRWALLLVLGVVLVGFVVSMVGAMFYGPLAVDGDGEFGPGFDRDGQMMDPDLDEAPLPGRVQGPADYSSNGE